MHWVLLAVWLFACTSAVPTTVGGRQHLQFSGWRLRPDSRKLPLELFFFFFFYHKASALSSVAISNLQAFRWWLGSWAERLPMGEETGLLDSSKRFETTIQASKSQLFSFPAPHRIKEPPSHLFHFLWGFPFKIDFNTELPIILDSNLVPPLW